MKIYSLKDKNIEWNNKYFDSKEKLFNHLKEFYKPSNSLCDFEFQEIEFIEGVGQTKYMSIYNFIDTHDLTKDEVSEMHDKAILKVREAVDTLGEECTSGYYNQCVTKYFNKLYSEKSCKWKENLDDPNRS